MKIGDGFLQPRSSAKVPKVPAFTPAISFIWSFGLGGGLAISEDYNLGSYRGTSVSVFSLKNNQWHQFWFDNGAPALLLEIDGNLANGMMDLEGDYFDDSNGRRLYSRLRYFNINGDTFSQLSVEPKRKAATLFGCLTGWKRFA